MINDSMFLLVKPTHECNLKCEYCYDKNEKQKVKNKKISDETIKQISKLAFNSYSKINWIWHGGEPLTIPMNNYTNWTEIINSFNKRDCKIEFGMQSNGSFFNSNIKKILEGLKIKYNISYDLINDNEKRINSKKIHEIDPYGQLAPITVVDLESSYKLIDTYEKMKLSKRKYTFNKIFLNKEMEESIKDYTENWKKYFEHYIFDKDCVNDDYLFHSIFNKIFGINKKISFCAEINCINHFLCVNPDGDVFPCDRFGLSNGERYKYNNVFDYKFSMNEYKETEGYKNFKNDLAIARESCKECDISIWCTGNCKANRVGEDGVIDVSKLNEYDCYFYKTIYNFIFDTIYNLKIEDFLSLNPFIYSTIFEEKILIKCFIKKMKEEEIDDKFIVG